MGWKKLSLAVLALSVFASQGGQAATESPRFNPPSTLTFDIPAGKTTTDDVSARRRIQGTPPIVYGFFGARPPAWVTIDENSGVLTMSPPKGITGTFDFFPNANNKPAVDGGDSLHYFVNVFTEPEWTGAVVDLGKINEGTSFTFDLNTVAKDPKGGALTFALVDPSKKFPSKANGGWIDTTNLASGKLSGVPARKDVGVFDGFSFQAKTSSGGTSTQPGKGEVVLVFKGPKWTAPTFALADVAQDTAFSESLMQTKYLTYSQAAPLQFEILPGSTNSGWLSTTSGNLAGRATQANAGNVSVKVRVSATYQGTVFSDDTTFNFKVKLDPPTWNAATIVLPDGFAGLPYTPADLKNFITAPHGNQLTFAIVPSTGPGWGTLSPAGIFSGNPLAVNMGVNEWTVQASDGQNTVPVKLRVTILKRPPVWKTNPVVLPPGLANVAYGVQDISGQAVDPDGAGKTFAIVPGSGPAWGTLTAGGIFSGNPKLADLGLNEWTVTVTSGGAPVPVKLQVTIGKRPPAIKSPIVLPNANATVAYGPKDISAQASDPDGIKPTWTLVSGPGWGNLTADGSFSGTPAKTDLGLNTWNVRVSNGTNSVDGVLSVTVVHAQPLWANSPIVLPDGTAGVVYAPQDLSTQATSPSDAKLTFAIVPGSGPAWASLSADGKVFTGTPQLANLGKNEWTVTVSDGTNTVPVKVSLTVGKRLPVWSENPIVLPDGPSGVPYPETDISAKASDPDKAPLTFSIVAGSGPAWGKVSAAGKFSGTPLLANLGVNEWTVQVTNGTNSATTKLQVTITKLPPKVKNPIVLPNAIAGKPYPEQNLAVFATDPDGIKPTFAFVPGGPDWAVLSTDGKFTGTPLFANLGPNVWTVQVSNGTTTVTTQVQLTVVLAQPEWVNNPIILPDATAGLPYGPQDISAQATSASGAPLKFALVAGSGPAWASLSDDGKAFSGTPGVANVGNNEWTVTVTDGTNTVPAKLRVKVVKRPPVWALNPIILPDGTAGMSYPMQDISVHASDPDDSKLTFSLAAGGPAWGKLSADGKFTGMSPGSAVGLNKWTVIASNGFTSATTELQVTIIKSPPVWSIDPIILPDAFANVPYGPQDISKFASTISGLPLTYALAPGGPAWAVLTPKGSFSGTPKLSDIGPNEWTVTVSDGTSTVSAKLQLTVAKRAPVCTNPVVLPDAKVGDNYDQLLTSFCKDPDGEPLSYIQTTASPWIFVTSTGRLLGTPSATDMGLNKVTVRATALGVSTDFEARVTVVPKGKPPYWTTPTLNLGDALVAKPFTFDLNPFAVSPAGLPLHFRKSPTTPTPAWLFVADNGQVTGTPALADLGPYTTVFEMSDDRATWVPVNAFGKVIEDSKPPVINAAALFFTVKVGEDFRVNLNQPLYVTDPSGLPLKFTMPDAEIWTMLQENGNLRLLPGKPELGDHTFQLIVTNTAGAKAQAPLKVKVIEGSKPPTMPDPIRFTAIVDKPFTGTLADKVVNPGGLPLKFVKNSGKPWLLLDGATGALSGTPVTADLGENFFSISVSTTDGTATSTVIVKVVPDGPNEDTIDISEPVDGARVDNLWVVDNQQDPCSGQSCLVTELKSNIYAYYDELNRAKVHHYGIFLAADACNYRSPITDSRGNALMEWDDPYWVKNFVTRVNKSVGQRDLSSPMVAQWQFLSTAGSSIKAPFFTKRVPMEILYVSGFGDQYKNYYHWPAISGWAPADFLTYFVNLFQKVEKPMRTSALAASYASYQTIVKGTGGKYYTYGRVDVRDSLKDYAKEVIFRAHVTAKKRVKLSKVPVDASKIKVTLAGNVLTTDKWRYDAATNEIEIFWHLIDLGSLKPGDKLVIAY